MDFRLFSSKIVHAELLRAGYDAPSLRTVARWTSSGKAPGWAEQAVRELLGAKPVPDWERLLLTVDAIAIQVGVSLDEAAAVSIGGNHDVDSSDQPGAAARGRA